MTNILPNVFRVPQRAFFIRCSVKKNITLNHKKAEGNEKLAAGDIVQMFFSDETFDKFAQSGQEEAAPQRKAPAMVLEVLYEDKDILIVNKPAGVLSQKAEKDDYSLVEAVTDYLLASGALTKQELRTFHPGICNRLDRNTSGIVVAGKSMYGLQEMTAAFKERTLHKYYLCIVKGKITKRSRVKGYLYKNERTNKVSILTEPPAARKKEALPIETEYIPVCFNRNMTLLKVNLLTGRSHQIRAHLAFLGHPLAGDFKYGDAEFNRYFEKQYGVRSQMLHAYQLELPSRPLIVTTAIPEAFCNALKGEGLWQHGIQEDLEALR